MWTSEVEKERRPLFLPHIPVKVAGKQRNDQEEAQEAQEA
jgi:hypothetical protein